MFGPYKHLRYDGCHSFLTVVYDRTRLTWIYLLTSKSQVCYYLNLFIPMAKTQFQAQVLKVRSDNGLEFFNHEVSALLTVLGIEQ